MKEEKRRYKRFQQEEPIRVRGIDIEGNPVEEEILAQDISASGASFVSTYDYNLKKPIHLDTHLLFPSGNGVKKRNWTIKAEIVRTSDIVRAGNGKLKMQNIVVKFNGILGRVPKE